MIEIIKRKKCFTIVFTILFAIIIASCSKKEQVKNIPMFKGTKTLSAVSKEMGVVIKSGSIYACGKYIVVFNGYDNADFHYAVFDSNLEYIYSFCGKGNGPGECLMPTFVKNSPEESFMVRDHADDNFCVYALTDSCAVFKEKFKLNVANNEFPFEINRVDSTRLFLKNTRYNRIRRQLWNLKSKNLITSIPSSFDFESKLGKDYHPEYDDFWISTSDDRFMCAYFFLDCIEFGKIENEKLDITRFWGSRETPDLIWYNQETPDDRFEYSIEYNKVYYECTSYGAGKFWASYAGVPWGELNFSHSKQIQCFDKEGKPLDEYILSEGVESFVVIDNPLRIVGVNSQEAEGKFLVFNVE